MSTKSLARELSALERLNRIGELTDGELATTKAFVIASHDALRAEPRRARTAPVVLSAALGALVLTMVGSLVLAGHAVG